MSREKGPPLGPLPSAPRTTDSRHGLPVFRNLVKDMNLARHNQVWAADIAYIRTDEGYLYLSPLMDLWSRKIAGYNAAAAHWKLKAPFAP